MSPPGPVEPAELEEAPKGGGKPAFLFCCAHWLGWTPAPALELAHNSNCVLLSHTGARHAAGYHHSDIARGQSLRPRDRTAASAHADARGRKSNRASRQRSPHCDEYPSPATPVFAGRRDRVRAQNRERG